MKTEQKFLDVFNSAQDKVENLLGKRPDDFKILLFVDPRLYGSVLLQTEKTGTPKAVVSSNELYVLQQMVEEGYVPTGKDLFFGARQPRIFFPGNSIQSKMDEMVVEAKLVHSLSRSLLCEETSSAFPDTLHRLYRHDTVIYDLFANNVYEFVMERGSSWVWQYFQDFTSVIRLLSLYDLDDFYVPPTTIRDASIFYNYLLEIKQIIKERSKEVTKAPLYDLVLQGFGDLALNQYIQEFDDDIQERLIPKLKANLGQPLGTIGAHFLKHHGETFEDQFEAALKLDNDQDLVKIWTRGETKDQMSELRDELMNKSMVWHSAQDSYWSNLWPMRGSRFDSIDAYVGKIQRRGYKSFTELQADSPLVTSHGRIKLKDREVSVLGIQEDTVGQEQLIILRNHLQAKKDTFSTPLPGLPDTIVFKKFAGMHVASYLGISDTKQRRTYPKSPYDLPVVVRAIQVSSRKDAYQSLEREDDGKIDEANYENLQGLTEPQHRAIRYLIRQRDVTQ